MYSLISFRGFLNANLGKYGQLTAIALCNSLQPHRTLEVDDIRSAGQVHENGIVIEENLHFIDRDICKSTINTNIN